MSQTTDVLNVEVNVTGDGQFRQRMQSITSSTLAYKAAIAGITLGAKKFIGSALEMASQLEEVQNVVDVTFGDMSESVNQFSKNALSQFGLSETIAKRYSGTFGAMAKSFGFATQQAANMSTELTGLVGDVASFYNLETDAAYTKLKSVFTGETESPVNTAVLKAALEDGFFELQIIDNTRIRADFWEKAGDDTLRGRFLAGMKRRMDECEDEPGRRKIEQAARWGIAALDNMEEVAIHDC